MSEVHQLIEAAFGYGNGPTFIIGDLTHGEGHKVAEWAGHSVNVLLKVYAKCIDGQEDLARRRIAEALGLAEEDAA